MALNALKFRIAIEDHASAELVRIESALKNLKDKDIKVNVNGLDELKKLLSTLSGSNSPASNVGEKLAKEVETATAALKKEEEALEKLKQAAKDANIGTAMAEDLRKAQAVLDNIQERLNAIEKKRHTSESALKYLNEQYGGSPFDLDRGKLPGLKEALAKDRAEQERNLSALEDKWNSYWAKQEANAEKFAIVCKKALDNIDYTDFHKHIFGENAELAKSWMMSYARDYYGSFFGKESELGKLMAKMRAQDKSGTLSDAERQEYKAYESYIRKVNDYFNQREKIANAYPNRDSVFRSHEIDVDAEKRARINLIAYDEVEKKLLQEKSVAQQKLNELKAQSAAQDQKAAQAREQVASQEQKVAQAKEKVAQATQAQANAEKQAQQGMSQKEIGATIRAAVIEDLKKSLSYISEAKEAIKGDSFTRFTERVNNAVEAINKLTEAFSKFKATIGGNQDLKDLLSGWGAALKEINAAMAAINAAKSSGGGRKKGVSGQSNEEIKQEEQGLAKVASALGQVRSAMGAGGSVNIPWMESITRVGERNIQTLIKEQGHIERLIAIAKKSIDFGEGHPVLGMGRLRGDQMDNLKGLENLKKSITEILYLVNQGDQKWIHFVNTVGSLRTTPFGKDAMGNDVTLLGGHFDKLTHSVTGTAQAMRTLNNDMRLDNANQYKQWNTEKLTEGLHRVNNAISDIKAAWGKASESADADMTRNVARQVNMLNELKASILSALSNNDVLRSPRGYQQVVNADSNEKINQAKRLKQELDGIARAEEKQAKEAERYTEQQKRAYEKAEKEKAAAIEKTRKEQERAAAQALRDQETQEKNQQRLNNVLNGTIALEERLSKAHARGTGLNLDTSLLESKYMQLIQMQSRVMNFSDFGSSHTVQMLIGEWNALQRELKGVAAAQEKVNNAEEKSRQKAATQAANQQAQAAKQAQKENEAWAESERKAAVEATNLEIRLRKLKDIEQKGSAVNVDTSQLRQQISLLEQYLNALRQIANGSRGFGHTADLLKDVGYQNASIRAKDEADLVKKATTEKERAAQVTSQLTSEQQRLAQALSQSNEKMRGQSQVLSDLKMLATQYLGVWGAQGFLKNIIEIGGQLEMQRLSIGAILQNQSQANTLFNQIKGLATQSPFGVVELDQMTKQLTAYGFKYHELFDMTKRLADISAATGTSVDRLALALGHVRSEAALSGYTLRQFSMGNVPLLQKLSEKLGKTTKEIRDMVKKKEVSYEDVVGVLKDLTNEGGMFYNMQEVISESVKAKFKNVKDAMDIMYGEMAEGGIGDALKGVANVLMELTRNWKDVATIMASVGGSWVFMRTVTMLYTQTLGAANAQTLASIAAHRQKEAAMLRQASIYRTLTTAERSQLATSKLLTTQERIRTMLGKPLTAQQELRILYARKQQVADLALALSQQKVTVETISRMVALKRLTMAEAIQIIKEAQLDAQIKATGYSMLNNTKILSGWRLGLARTQLALSGFGASLKAFFSWPMLLMTAFTAVIELWQRNSREMEAADELANSIYQHSQEAIKNTRTMMQNNEMSIVNANGKGVNTADLNISNISSAKIKFPEIDKGDMQQTIEEWTTYIENYAVNAGQILNNAFFGADGSLLSLEERFNNLKVAIEEVVLAQYGLQDMDVVFSNAVKETDGGWFDDNVMTDIGNYEKKLKSFSANVTATYRKYQKAIDNGVKAAEKQSETFANATKDMDTYAQKFMFLAKYQEAFSDAWRAFGTSADTSDAIERLNFSLFHTTQDDMKNARKEMVEELDAFYAQVTAEMQTKGVDVNNMTKEQQQALLIGYKQQLESIQGLSEETMRWLMKLFAKHFNIPLNLDDSKFVPKVNETTQLLDSLVEGDWTVVIKFAEHINDAIDDARKKYKQAKEYFEKANPILLKFGLSAKIGTKLTEEQIKAAVAKAPEFVREALEKALRGWNEMTDIFNKSSEASKALGFSLEDEKKKKSDIDKKKKDAEKAAKKEEDREIKGWKERIRLLRDARSWYDKWEKEVGHSAALEKVQEMFKGLVSKKDIESLEAYEKALDAVIAKAQARRAKNKGKDERAEEVIRQGEDEKAQIAMLKFQRDSTAFTSDFDKEMEQLTRRWEIFNSVLDATGDKLLAVRMAGFQKGDKDFNARNAADSLRNRLDAAMIFPGLDKTIDFDAVSNMSEEDIDKHVKRLLGGTEYESMIGGIAKGLKEWKKLSDDVIKNDIVGYAQLVGAAVDYGTQIQKNNKDFDERKKMLLSLLAIGKISDAHFDEALSQAAAERDYKNFQLSPAYYNLMNNASALTHDQVTHAIEGAMDNLNKMYDHNLITLQQYREEVEKLEKARRDWEEGSMFNKTNALTSFLGGGTNGLRAWLVGERDRYHDSGEEDEEKTMQGYIDKLDQATDFIGDLNIIVGLVTGTFEGLQRAATALSNMFDALGEQGKANTWGDIADGIGAVSSIFNPVSGVLQSAKNGDVGGLISNAIAAPFEMVASPIAGFAQLHDKKRERQIEELKHEVEKIDDTLNLIRKSRDRSLGYDRGSYRKMMAAMYAGNRSDSGKAMYEYYMRGSGETGYAQELEALKTQREEYLKMYDKENDKKKKSKEALEEYKQKMAELDDQIVNYTQDLANELWSIDLKGWADQIGDALMNAFENGTSAALAYENAVSDIMRSVVSQMLKVGIIEPMMENLRQRLFGENGAFNYNDPSGSMGAVLSELGRFFGKGGEGEQMMTAADEFLTGAEQLLNENYGITLKSSSQASQTEGIKSQATEETIGILSGQMARIAQDVSVKRIFLTQLVTQQMPTLLERTERQVAMTEVSLQSLRAIEHAMVDGNGAMYDAIYRMSQKIDRAITPDGYMKVQ